MAISEVIEESGSRVERKRTRNHDALAAAARALFSRDGFEATTIAGIAEAADLGFGTFYRYFADKEAALEAVLADAKAEVDAALMVQEPPGTPADVALARLSERFVQVVRRDKDLLTIVWDVTTRKVASRRRLNFESAPGDRSLPAVLADAIQGIVATGIEDGKFTPGDARVLSRLIAGAHMSLLTPQAQEMDAELLITTLQEFELRALGVPAKATGASPTRRGR